MIDDDGSFESVLAAATYVRSRAPDPWPVGLVLGSGLSSLSDQIDIHDVIPFREIPGFPTTTVAGHPGDLVLGSLAGKHVAALRGRIHFYEGLDLSAVVFPTRVLRLLGVRILILTAAAGGIREDLIPGDIVCIDDHLNLLGSSPSRGPNDDRFGSRFPDMSDVYCPELRKLARDVAAQQNIILKEGVYAAVAGPQYETPAEVRMLRTLGADVVGMSTVPEAIAARHGGVRVLAFALVTNCAAGVTPSPLDHQEVLAAGTLAGPRLGQLIEGILRGMN